MMSSRAKMSTFFPDTATVTETGPGGQQEANRDHGWGAVVSDGTQARVFLTAKVDTCEVIAKLHMM